MSTRGTAWSEARAGALGRSAFVPGERGRARTACPVAVPKMIFAQGPGGRGRRVEGETVMRQVVGGSAVVAQAASASQMGRFESETLALAENRAALADLNGQWIDRCHGRNGLKRIVLDMDPAVVTGVARSPARGRWPRRGSSPGSGAQTRHEIVELLPLHGDVGPDRVGRGRGIGLFERGDDRLVLGHGLGKPSAQP